MTETTTEKTKEKLFHRTKAEILAAHRECWDKVAWYRHEVTAQKIARGEMAELGPETGWPQGCDVCKGIEDRYGRANLLAELATPFDIGLLTGRLSALQWLDGFEWHESMDT